MESMNISIVKLMQSEILKFIKIEKKLKKLILK
jgi:hypothetical protein